jgi:hypothetical protein
VNRRQNWKSMERRGEKPDYQKDWQWDSAFSPESFLLLHLRSDCQRLICPEVDGFSTRSLLHRAAIDDLSYHFSACLTLGLLFCHTNLKPHFGFWWRLGKLWYIMLRILEWYSVIRVSPAIKRAREHANPYQRGLCCLWSWAFLFTSSVHLIVPQFAIPRSWSFCVAAKHSETATCVPLPRKFPFSRNPSWKETFTLRPCSRFLDLIVCRNKKHSEDAVCLGSAKNPQRSYTTHPSRLAAINVIHTYVYSWQLILCRYFQECTAACHIYSALLLCHRPKSIYI